MHCRYCECFRSGGVCGDLCKCTDCANSEDPAFQAERQAVMDKIVHKKKCDIFALARREQEERKAQVAAAAAVEAEQAAAAVAAAEVEAAAASQGMEVVEEAVTAADVVPTRRLTRAAAAAASSEDQQGANGAADGMGAPPTPVATRGSGKREVARTPQQPPPTPGSASKRVRALCYVCVCVCMCIEKGRPFLLAHAILRKSSSQIPTNCPSTYHPYR